MGSCVSTCDSVFGFFLTHYLGVNCQAKCQNPWLLFHQPESFTEVTSAKCQSEIVAAQLVCWQLVSLFLKSVSCLKRRTGELLKASQLYCLANVFIVSSSARGGGLCSSAGLLPLSFCHKSPAVIVALTIRDFLQ